MISSRTFCNYLMRKAILNTGGDLLASLLATSADDFFCEELSALTLTGSFDVPPLRAKYAPAPPSTTNATNANTTVMEDDLGSADSIEVLCMCCWDEGLVGGTVGIVLT